MPYHSNNAITHFLTNTCPLMTTLENMAPHCLNALTFPTEMNGHQLSFLKTLPQTLPFNPIPLIPSYFWHSKIFHTLPSNFRYRKVLCSELFDLDHKTYCSTEEFHLYSELCICTACEQPMTHYHRYFCVEQQQ